MDRMEKEEEKLYKTLKEEYGQVWNTEELQKDFEVLGFASPLVVVKRKADRVKGSLLFTHYPRFYYSFIPEKMDYSTAKKRDYALEDALENMKQEDKAFPPDKE